MNKIFKTFFTLVLIISCGMLFTACGNSNDPKEPLTYYTVTFETNGGSDIESQ